MKTTLSLPSLRPDWFRERIRFAKSNSKKDKQKQSLVLKKSQLVCFDQVSASKHEQAFLKHFSSSCLGPDESSKYFIKREKSIAFVYTIGNKLFRLDQDYFIQNSDYNDFSGGYRRQYELIPKNVIMTEPVSNSILEFKRHFHIPDLTTMLVQIQSSIIDPPKGREKEMKDKVSIVNRHGIHTDDSSFTILSSTEDKNILDIETTRQKTTDQMEEVDDDEDANSVTGQGIHTDGASHAMLYCIERTNVLGATNSFYKDLQGTEQLGESVVLDEGDVVYFQDDSVYHYVSPAFCKDKVKPMRRSMMLIHSPADIYFSGSRNKENSGGTRKSFRRLRDSIIEP